MKNFTYGNAIVIGAGFAGIFIVYTIFNNFVPILLADFGLSATVVAFIMTWDNYFSMFLQPLIGQWSDQTHSPIGRRKPWLLFGAPIAATAFVVIPTLHGLIPLMVAVLCTNVGLALFRPPTVALMGDLYPPHQRSTANSILNVLGGIGAIVALVGGGVLYQYGQAMPFIFGSSLLLGAVGFLVGWIREPVVTRPLIPAMGIAATVRDLPQAKNRQLLGVLLTVMFAFMGIQALQTWLSSFGKFGLGIDPGRMALLVVCFAISYLIVAVPSGLLASRVGRRPVILMGLMMMSSLLSLGWFIYNETTLIIMLLSTGGAWALVSINLLPAVYDVTDDSHIGRGTGLYYLSTNVAAIVGPQVAGILIDMTDKNYWMMFIVGALCMVIALICLLSSGRYQQDSKV